MLDWCGGNVSLTSVCTLVMWAAIAVAAYFVVDLLLEKVVKRLVAYTPTTWDDDLLNPRVLHAVSHIAPPMVLERGLIEIARMQSWANWLLKFTDVYVAVMMIVLACALLRGITDHLKGEEKFATYPIHGMYQALKLVVIVIGSLVCLAILIDRDPLTVIAGLGASAAILSLVFKDTLMGFVAGIQLSANSMLHEGDWIVASKFNADGTVMSIGLTTIKVCNWDKSVTTIPTYSLISESFQNWERMREYGARRVKRHFLVDANSVRFLTADECERLGIDAKADEVVNTRAFREHLEQWLAVHPKVTLKDGTTTMVRQLQPTAEGLPIEIYFFTKTTEWVEYEHIQADVLDHVYATCQLYGLRIYQRIADRG